MHFLYFLKVPSVNYCAIPGLRKKSRERNCGKGFNILIKDFTYDLKYLLCDPWDHSNLKWLMAVLRQTIWYYLQASTWHGYFKQQIGQNYLET